MNTNPAGYTYLDYLMHSDDELYHFGIKGMKWGVRRGRRASGGSRRAPLTPEQRAERNRKLKKAAMITAGLAGAAALGYGAYRLHKAGKLPKFKRRPIPPTDPDSMRRNAKRAAEEQFAKRQKKAFDDLGGFTEKHGQSMHFKKPTKGPSPSAEEMRRRKYENKKSNFNAEEYYGRFSSNGGYHDASGAHYRWNPKTKRWQDY